MSKQSEDYERRAEALLLPILGEHDFELVDVEYVKEGDTWYLRAYIDKEGGITVDDCETASRAFSDALDREDFIDGAYVLEVSSPGLTRPLKKEKDYIRAQGKEVELHTFARIDGEKEFTGTLVAFDGDTVTIRPGDGEEKTFQKKDLALIRMALDF